VEPSDEIDEEATPKFTVKGTLTFTVLDVLVETPVIFVQLIVNVVFEVRYPDDLKPEVDVLKSGHDALPFVLVQESAPTELQEIVVELPDIIGEEAAVKIIDVMGIIGRDDNFTPVKLIQPTASEPPQAYPEKLIPLSETP
jgi:hypothetical protein